MEAIEIARRVVEIASDKQAVDTVLLDMKEACFFADYFVICNGESSRQIESIRQEIAHLLKKQGIILHHSEGTTDSGWVLLDFGSVIVHIFAPQQRDYYQLDRLWDKAAPVIRLQ